MGHRTRRFWMSSKACQYLLLVPILRMDSQSACHTSISVIDVLLSLGNRPSILRGTGRTKDAKLRRLWVCDVSHSSAI
ncbi:hypothetical protein DFP72DRAFT_875958 [Ephemerocybe angulata]|uniref:Secreted protein n=1 Tax=Ephemerocybe angulata TaxID=980116 RepID=A0A8H6IC97_9AGAR|nr:hypothetical protein DFP72DRAFT_875958 [Tulosesus angulatus]